MTDIFVTDIKLASILISLGVPLRNADPITCEIYTKENQRTEQYKFWFGVDDLDHREKAKETIDAYSKAKNWEKFTLDEDHPLYWMKGALETREVLLGWMRKNVEPIKVIQHGEKTILIGERASHKLREKMKRLL
jgi:hypothetical protein